MTWPLKLTTTLTIIGLALSMIGAGCLALAPIVVAGRPAGGSFTTEFFTGRAHVVKALRWRLGWGLIIGGNIAQGAGAWLS